MTTCYIMQGLPASGKSTAARGLEALRFSLDDYRAMCGTGKETWSHDKEQAAVAAMIAGAKAAILAGFDVVMDNTHLVPRLPRMYRKAFAPLRVTFEVHSFLGVPIAECILRDAEREAGVGVEVIEKMAKIAEGAGSNGWRLTDKWMNSTAYVMPRPYAGTRAKPDAIIVDIDGTVATHGTERGHYEYDKVDGDLANEDVCDLVVALAGDFKIIYLSGRQDSCREMTEKWIAENALPQAPLFMRATDDMRPDYIIKQELFDAHVRDNFNVVAVLDDRTQVVEYCWRAMGLTCLQVAKGDF